MDIRKLAGLALTAVALSIGAGMTAAFAVYGSTPDDVAASDEIQPVTVTPTARLDFNGHTLEGAAFKDANVVGSICSTVNVTGKLTFEDEGCGKATTDAFPMLSIGTVSSLVMLHGIVQGPAHEVHLLSADSKLIQIISVTELPQDAFPGMSHFMAALPPATLDKAASVLLQAVAANGLPIGAPEVVPLG